MRYYQRLVAMKLIESGLSHKKIAEILQISYRTLYRWAKTCEEFGIAGLEPNFNGGRRSKFTKEDRKKFEKILDTTDNLTITDAKNILMEDFNLDFTLSYVGRLVKDLGFNYGSAYVSYKEEPENAEEFLKKTLKKQK